MKQLLFCIFLLLLEGCSSNQPPAVSGQIDELPAIYPDYIDVTIPQSIAPLNFAVQTEGKACAVFTTEGYAFTVYASNGAFSIPDTDWEKLLTAAKGKQVEVSVLTEEKGKWNAFLPFHIRVSEDPIDPYIAYRLIDPGYQLWNEMGIYQRELSSFDQEPILENRLTDNNCMNCHSFCMQDPDKMLFHVRAKYGCTVFVDGDRIETLDTKTDRTISALVYPSWHPSGKFVAFSINNTTQDTHPVHRTEVYDKASDVVVYDVEKQEIVTTQALFSKKHFETFPTFSPDGKQLYFCSAPALKVPGELRDLVIAFAAFLLILKAGLRFCCRHDLSSGNRRAKHFVSPCLARRKISALYNDILRNLPYLAQRCGSVHVRPEHGCASSNRRSEQP